MLSGQTQQCCAQNVPVPAALPWPGGGGGGREGDSRLNPLTPGSSLSASPSMPDTLLNHHAETPGTQLLAGEAWRGQRQKGQDSGVTLPVPRLREGPREAPHAKRAPPLVRKPGGLSTVRLRSPTPGPQDSLVTALSPPRWPNTC